MKKAVLWDKTARCQPSTTGSKGQLHTFSSPKTRIFELENISKQGTMSNTLLYLILPKHYALRRKGWKYGLHKFLISVLDRGERTTSCTRRFYPWQRNKIPTEYKTGWVQDLCFCPEIDTLSSEIRPTFKQQYRLKHPNNCLNQLVVENKQETVSLWKCVMSNCRSRNVSCDL